MNEGQEKFIESGKILAAVREYVRGLSIQGRPILEVCELVEGKIRELGAGPAFPCNVGINDVAAHYTSPWRDTSVIPSSSIVKIDFGVELDGFVTDTAIAISLNPAYDSMVVAAETCCRRPFRHCAWNRKLSDIGSVVERCIQRYGFRPIRNLTGHKIDRYTYMLGNQCQTWRASKVGSFELGEVYAIEPFVTLREAEGAVSDGSMLLHLPFREN